MSIDRLKQFVSLLPKVSRKETYFFMCMHRGKYSKTNNKDMVLKRNDTSNLMLYRELKFIDKELIDFETEEVLKDDDALVTYLQMNPRSLELAELLRDKMIAEDRIKSYRDKAYKTKSTKSIYKDAVQIAKGKRKFIDIDIDIDKDENGKKKVSLNTLLKVVFSEITIYDIFMLVETNGGYHMLVDLDRIDKSKGKWFINIREKLKDIDGIEVDNIKDSLIPVPGKKQGGFEPRVIFMQKDLVILAPFEIWNTLLGITYIPSLSEYVEIDDYITYKLITHEEHREWHDRAETACGGSIKRESLIDEEIFEIGETKFTDYFDDFINTRKTAFYPKELD